MTPKSRPGPLGASCLTCKRRHKKCDQRQPVCKRCETGRFECLGYGHNRKAPALVDQSEDVHVPKASKNGCSSKSTSLRSGYERGALEGYPVTPECPGASSSPLAGPSRSVGANGNNLNPAPDNSSPSALVSSKTHRVEDYLYLFATRSTFKVVDSPMSVLRKIVNLQAQLPYSPLDPLKTFLNSQWFVDYIIAQSDKLLESWYFKPTNYEKKDFLECTAHRLQSSNFARWIILVAVGILQSFYSGEMWQNSQHSFWLGYIVDSARHELTRDLTSREIQERRSDYIHVSLMKAIIIHSSNIYQTLRNITPIFLQVAFSNPTLWPHGCEVTRVPLSNILASEGPELAFFVFMDCTCAMAFGLPQQVEYDTTIYSRPAVSPSHQWAHSTPIDFQPLLADINACRDKSLAARDWRDIEQWLLTWQSRPGEHTFTESWMTIAWYAVQESWRLALLAYLYVAVCDTPSDDPQIQSYIKQILQVVGTVKGRRSSSVHVSFFVQYLMVGICAQSELHRKAVRDKLSASNETKLWILRARDFVPVLDHLWHGAAAGGRPIKWRDYVRSREAVLPIVM